MDRTTIKLIAKSWISSAIHNIEIAKEKRWGLSLEDLISKQDYQELQKALRLLKKLKSKLDEQ